MPFVGVTSFALPPSCDESAEKRREGAREGARELPERLVAWKVRRSDHAAHL